MHGVRNVNGGFLSSHWHLETPILGKQERREEDGRISFPPGEDATGYIMYNQDGYMFVAIMSPYRLKFAGGDLLSGTTEEEAQAEETFLSYCGRYELREDRVIHQIELSLVSQLG